MSVIKLNMVLTEEEKRERQRGYNKTFREKHKEELKEYFKKVRLTDVDKKSATIRKWRKRGVKGDLEKLYEIREKTTYCDVCNKEFDNSVDKHLDHDHETGEFRWILCRSCNVNDNWKNYFT